LAVVRLRLIWSLLLGALTIVVVAGCQPEEATNTPLPAAAIERATQAESPTLLTLARNPGAFEGKDLRLSGAYRPLPLQICVGETHQSPATWALVDGEVQILASGFDSELRKLAPPGLPLEVEGRWQRWQGPVGCGRRAASQLVWHLQLTDILSPNPLSAAIPFTPEAIGAVTTTPTPDSLAAGEATAPPLTNTIPVAEEPSGNLPTATPGGSPTQTPFASATAGADDSPAGSATVTTSPAPAGSGTPSATPSGTGTPTPNSLTATPTATTTPRSPTPTPTVDSGQPRLLDYDELSKRTIAAGGVQEWQFAGSIDSPIIINVAPSSELDISLELRDPTDQLVGVYDHTGAGQTETITENELPRTGLYTLQVSSILQSSGNYAIVLQSESSRPFVEFQGLLTYGVARAGTTPIDGDHLWNFEGVAGDVVNIRVTATTQTDMQIYLNGHNGVETEFVDDNTVYFPPQDREEILGYVLPASGLYTVGIGEENFQELGYSIIIEKVS
jgi:hypothetical protein